MKHFWRINPRKKQIEETNTFMFVLVWRIDPSISHKYNTLYNNLISTYMSQSLMSKLC